MDPTSFDAEYRAKYLAQQAADRCPAHWDAEDARGDRVTVARCSLEPWHKGNHIAHRVTGEPHAATLEWPK